MPDQSDLQHLLTANFGRLRYVSPLAEFMQVKRQTVWYWMQIGGVPRERRDDFVRFCAESEIKFPPGKSLDDYIHDTVAYLGRPPKNENREKENRALIVLLSDLCANRNYGLAFIEHLAKYYLRLPIHRLFKWAYDDGGVPKSKINEFATALLAEEVNVFMGIEDEDAFRDHVRQAFSVTTRQPPEKKARKAAARG